MLISVESMLGWSPDPRKVSSRVVVRTESHPLLVLRDHSGLVCYSLLAALAGFLLIMAIILPL